MKNLFKHKILWVAALGYFVDLYDLVLYGVVRVQSLKDLHVPASEIFSVGSTLLNFQMGGMLAGGLAWGILGDKRGRRAALFGSIFLYSIATLLNSFVQTVPQYAVLRFIAGFGLAGELGTAITLLSETLPLASRGMGATLVASVGFMGAALSSYLAQFLTWQNAYISGGILGLLLLFARLNLSESSVFVQAQSKVANGNTLPGKNHRSEWGSLRLLFSSSSRVKKIIFCLFMGVPIWYVAGILGYFAPELARELHVQGEVKAGTTIMLGYLGAIIGDILCGLLSQYLKSRKKAVLIFLFFSALCAPGHVFFMENASANAFYATRFVIGLGTGYMAVMVAWISELFGTNLRATATTFIPNLIRAAIIPLTASLKFLQPSFGLIPASLGLGIFCFVIAVFSVTQLDETFHREIAFREV